MGNEIIDINDAYSMLISTHEILQEKFYAEIDEWKPEVPPVTEMMSALGEAILFKELEFEDKEYSVIFSTIEKLIINGDDKVKTAITTGLLETLVNLSDNKSPSRFTNFIGDQAKKYCLAWDDFTGVKTSGLYDDGD